MHTPAVNEACDHSPIQNAPFANALQEMIQENVLESMPSGLMIVGKGGRVLQVNSTLAGILGFPRDVLLQQGWSVLFIDLPDNAEFNNTLLDVIQKEQVRHIRQVWYVRPDNRRLFLEIISSFLHIDQDNWGLVVLVQDITELRLLHDREKAALEQKRLAEQQRADSLNNLALSIAHQIRNPVMTIGGFANLALRNRQDPAKVATYLETVNDSAARLERMAQAVREFVSIGPGKMTVFALADVLPQAAQRLRAKAEQQGARLRLALDCAHEWHVRADPEQLAAALDAVLENALEAYEDARDRERLISLAARRKNGMLALVVADKGRGIPEKDLPYVCDPFFTTKAVGAGMGLALAQRILIGHGGSLDIDNCGGEGVEVTMTLPRAETDDGALQSIPADPA